MFRVLTNQDFVVSQHETVDLARTEADRLNWEATASPAVGRRYWVEEKERAFRELQEISDELGEVP